MTLELGPPPRSRLRIAIGAAVVLVLIGLVAAVLASMLAPQGAVAEALAGPGVTIEAASEAPERLLIHVLGAVERPGVYELDLGARVLDAVAAAGGLAEDADPSSVNLARPLVDAEQLRVPRIGETVPQASGTDAAHPPGIAADGRVDLNAADAAALTTLPRIGPATAARIIQWREANGGFRSIEDLLAVSGIGQKTFESLRELVTV